MAAPPWTWKPPVGERYQSRSTPSRVYPRRLILPWGCTSPLLLGSWESAPKSPARITPLPTEPPMPMSKAAPVPESFSVVLVCAPSMVAGDVTREESMEIPSPRRR
jgi:hypothetical protein